MQREQVMDRVRKLAEPLLQTLGLECYDLHYRREGGRWVLRLFIDRPEGVSLDDCERVSRELGVLLDVEDLIPHSYALEVSSPGLDRALRGIEEYRRFAGRRVRLQVLPARPAGGEGDEGKRTIEGVLRGVEGETVQVEAGRGEVLSIPWETILKARLLVDFST
ncbi:MAG: ribosome maturation factor RimP [Nitrospirae bacterium]|nr:ribosome maturation factor RimP [Nitrospirota bacterium]